jgi:hypothetical protein
VSLRKSRLWLIYLLLAPLAFTHRCFRRHSGWIAAKRGR